MENEKEKHSLKIGGRWQHIRTKLKEKYPFLTDKDLTWREGEDDLFVGRLQRRLGGEKREKIVDMIRTL